MTESRFRERRSAHRDEPGVEPEAPEAPALEIPTPAAELEPAHVAAPPPPAAAPAAGPAPSFAEPVAPAPPAGGPQTAEPGEPVTELDQLADMEVPEPSFLELVEPHIEMALRFLGELPLTPEGERRVLPRWAKREIDLLGLVEQRTRGNLPPDEEEYLRQALDHLRTMYLKASR